MKPGRQLFAFLCCAFLAAAFTCDCSAEPPHHRSFDLVLPAAKVAALNKRALAGDGPAAYELYMHYSVGFVDERQGILWLRLAYRLREPRARKLVRMMREDQPEEYARFAREKTLPSR